MTNYEFLRNMYPEWESQNHPLLPLIQIFLIIALFLVIPYIYIKFIECRLVSLQDKIRAIIGFSKPPSNIS